MEFSKTIEYISVIEKALSFIHELCFLEPLPTIRQVQDIATSCVCRDSICLDKVFIEIKGNIKPDEAVKNYEYICRNVTRLIDALKARPFFNEDAIKNKLRKENNDDNFIKFYISQVALIQMYCVDRVDDLTRLFKEIKGVNISRSIDAWQEIALQSGLNTDKAKRVFQKAIEAGLMCKDGTVYKWNKSNALLAYLCGRLYCGDKIEKSNITKDWVYKRGSTFFPESALCSLFGVKHLGQSRMQMERPPRGYEDVNLLFD